LAAYCEGVGASSLEKIALMERFSVSAQRVNVLDYKLLELVSARGDDDLVLFIHCHDFVRNRVRHRFPVLL